MKVLGLKDVVRKDVPIYYRRLFSGIIVLELMNKKTAERKIDFSIETKPTGQKAIIVKLAEAVDYPLIPVIHEIKQYIDNLDGDGGLPLE
ncbi:MAG: hypothetical protein LBP76_00195 [Treponema sp.]|jgi:hypothetical protein|nr:hypothetical protein [Treponema sp.]